MIVGIGTGAGLALAGAHTVTIGQTGADDVCGSDNLAVQTGVSSGTSYKVPEGHWTITSWSAQGGPVSGGELALVVLRPKATAHTYRVVGSSSTQALTAGVLSTFPTDIEVRGGDLIGNWGTAPTYCDFVTGSADDTYDLVDLSAPPSSDTPLTLAPFSSVRQNVSVTLKPLAAKVAPAPAAEPAHIAICTAKPVLRADGTMGTFADVLSSQFPTSDPNSPYFGAAPANYVEGVGLTCDLPPGYVDAGYKVNGDGVKAPPGYEAVWFAPYEYYAKA